MLNYMALMFCANFVFNMYGMETKTRVAMAAEVAANADYNAAISHPACLATAVTRRANPSEEEVQFFEGIVLNGDTPLVQAISSGEDKMAHALIKAGLNVNNAATGGITALMMAVTLDNEELVKALLANGAAVNAQDAEGMTVLMRAAKIGNSDMVRLLFNKYSADIKLKNKQGKTAKDILRQEHEPYRRALDLTEAIINNWPRDIDTLLAQEIDVNAISFYVGSSPILLAVQFDMWDVVEKLLKLGADLNAQNRNGISPLLYILDDFKSIKTPLVRVKFLIASGADINPPLNYDKKPLELFLNRYDDSDALFAEVEALLTPKVVELAAGLSLSLSED